MSEADDVQSALSNNEKFEHFQKSVTEELLKLGPHPRRPLTVTQAADVAGVSLNTAGKYVDILRAEKRLEVVDNPPRKDLYLTAYPADSNGKRGAGGI